VINCFHVVACPRCEKARTHRKRLTPFTAGEPVS
jgi:hypothetical protein